MGPFSSAGTTFPRVPCPAWFQARALQRDICTTVGSRKGSRSHVLSRPPKVGAGSPGQLRHVTDLLAHAVGLQKQPDGPLLQLSDPVRAWLGPWAKGARHGDSERQKGAPVCPHFPALHLPCCPALLPCRIQTQTPDARQGSTSDWSQIPRMNSWFHLVFVFQFEPQWI